MQILRYDLPLDFYGTIIDIETSGLVEWKEEIICCGVLTGSHILIYYHIEPIGLDKDLLVKNISSYNRPFFAFNKNMEERFLNIKVDYDIYTFHNGRYTRKLDAIIIRDYITKDVLSGDGSRCPEHWNRYKETKDISCLEIILRHNRSCLIQELTLLLYGNIK